jgi:chorismate synthase
MRWCDVVGKFSWSLAIRQGKGYWKFLYLPSSIEGLKGTLACTSMPGNTFGTALRVTTFGESHGKAVGVVVDGFPADFVLDLAAIQHEMDRRRPGQSKLVTQRKEGDRIEIFSGVFEGKTTGTSLMAMVLNTDTRSKDYDELAMVFRPGHADFTYFAKYGHRDHRGGGRASVRESVGRVFAGALAKQLLAKFGITVRGGVTQVGKVHSQKRVWDEVEHNEIRSVDPDSVAAMRDEIEKARKDRDSVGGVIEVIAEGVPPGLGEPVFGKLDAEIAAALMSIPAVKGVEFGAGFASAAMRGSEMNDELFPEGFVTNNHGGTLGGISSGAPIVARLVVKPTSSIPQDKNTIDVNFQPRTVATRGRHDPCVAIRGVPIAEAMLALVLADYLLQDLATRGAREYFSPRDYIKYDFATGMPSRRIRK